MLEVYPHFTGDGYGAEWYDPATGGWMHWAWDPLEAVAGLMEMVAAAMLEAAADEVAMEGTLA